MKRESFIDLRIRLIASFALLLTCAFECSADELSGLDSQLANLRYSERARGVALADLEKRCLSLIEDHNSPAEKGRIYATIASLYGERGYDSAEDPRIGKTILYTAKALEHPLDVLTACDMYGRQGGAIMAQCRNYTQGRFSEERPKVLLACLKGLKLTLDNGAPPKPPEEPEAMARVSVAPGSPEYDRLMAQYHRQIEAWEKWEFLSKLYAQRWALTQQCITLYARKPYNREEFVSQAGKVLVGHDDVVREITTQIEQRIAFDKSIGSFDPNASSPKR